MNPRSTLAAGTLTVLAALTLSVSPAYAGGRCDNPRTFIEQRACHEAAQGPDALRRFVERTRMIYSLYYADFARDEAPVPAKATASEPSNPRS